MFQESSQLSHHHQIKLAWSALNMILGEILNFIFCVLIGEEVLGKQP